MTPAGCLVGPSSGSPGKKPTYFSPLWTPLHWGQHNCFGLPFWFSLQWWSTGLPESYLQKALTTAFSCTVIPLPISRFSFLPCCTSLPSPSSLPNKQPVLYFFYFGHSPAISIPKFHISDNITLFTLALHTIIDMIRYCCPTNLYSPERPFSYVSEVWQSVTQFSLTICKI